jgi:hypothetical protein
VSSCHHHHHHRKWASPKAGKQRSRWAREHMQKQNQTVRWVLGTYHIVSMRTSQNRLTCPMLTLPMLMNWNFQLTGNEGKRYGRVWKDKLGKRWAHGHFVLDSSYQKEDEIIRLKYLSINQNIDSWRSMPVLTYMSLTIELCRVPSLTVWTEANNQKGEGTVFSLGRKRTRWAWVI